MAFFDFQMMAMITRLLLIGFPIIFLAIIFSAGGCRNTVSQIAIADPLTTVQVKQEELPLKVPTDTSDVVYRGLKQKNSVYN